MAERDKVKVSFSTNDPKLAAFLRSRGLAQEGVDEPAPWPRPKPKKAKAK